MEQRKDWGGRLLILDFQRVVEDRYWWTIIGSLVDVVDPVLQNFYPIMGEMIYMMLKRKGISSLWLLFEALMTIDEDDTPCGK